MTDIFVHVYLFFYWFSFHPFTGWLNSSIPWLQLCGKKQKDVPNKQFPSRLNTSFNLDQSFSLKAGQHTENLKNGALFNLKKNIVYIIRAMIKISLTD